MLKFIEDKRGEEMIIREAFDEYERAEEYDQYLKDHIGNVIRTWDEILRPALETLDEFKYDDGETLDDYEFIIRNHDKSKYDKEEYVPYLHHFYPVDYGEIPEDDIEFDEAWLRHQHLNPHHWQHWVLVKDSGETVPMPMPKCYVLEMLCDWHSFSAKNPESTAKAWYEQNKSKMILHDGTKEWIEEYIDYLSEPLGAE